MKKIFVLAVSLTSLISSSSFGQIDLDQILKGTKADANYLAEGYLRPVLNSVSSGLNQGWYNTAANHKTLGFDLTVSVSLIYYPTTDLFYKVDNSKLTNLKIINPADNSAPTFIGPKTPLPQYDYKSGPSAPFFGPAGIDVKNSIGGLPLPIANLGIGLPKSIDLKVRFLPTTKIGSGTNVSLFGLGILHDIKQYIPGIKMVPFDLSVFAGYTKFKTDVAFDPARPDQIGKSEFSSTTIQALIGKKFSVVTLYGSAGYNFSSGSFKATGSYPDSNTGLTLVDPISLTSSVSGPRVTGGLRLKFAVFTLHADYTLQTYKTLTVGFGIAVR